MEPTNYQNPTEFSTPPKNWLVESILVTLFCYHLELLELSMLLK